MPNCTPQSPFTATVTNFDYFVMWSTRSIEVYMQTLHDFAFPCEDIPGFFRNPETFNQYNEAVSDFVFDINTLQITVPGFTGTKQVSVVLSIGTSPLDFANYVLNISVDVVDGVVVGAPTYDYTNWTNPGELIINLASYDYVSMGFGNATSPEATVVSAPVNATRFEDVNFECILGDAVPACGPPPPPTVNVRYYNFPDGDIACSNFSAIFNPYGIKRGK
jgi:hypothetical protein